MRTTLRDLIPSSRRSGDDDNTLRGSNSNSITATYNANSTSASDTDEKRGRPEPVRRKTRGDGKRELTSDDCAEELGYKFSTFKKWVSILFDPFDHVRRLTK